MDINSSILFAQQDGDSGKRERDSTSTAYFGGKNRVDLGQLRQVLGYQGTVEQQKMVDLNRLVRTFTRC